MLTRRASLLLAVPVALVLLGYVVWPSVGTFLLGLDGDVLRGVFGGGRAAGVRGLLNSVGVSLGTVVLGGMLGTALAWALWRYRLPGGRLLGVVAALPLALPPLVGVLAFLFLYGESGILPRGLQTLLGLDAVPFAFEGRGAVLVVHVYSFYVYFYLFVSAALADLDRGLVEASADLGAGGWTTFRRVVLPLLRPALVGAALLVFMLSMASFTAPLLFAGGEPFLTTQIFQFKQNGALDRAAAVSVVLTAICLLFLVLIEARPGAARGRGTASKGAGRAGAPVRSGWGRAVAGGLAGLFLLFVLLPVATVVLLSFVEQGSWTTQVLPSAYTLAHYAALVGDPSVVEPIVNSLWMAAVSTAANLVFGVAAALVIAKGRVPGRGLLRALALLPFAIPGTVIALNLIVAFDQPTPLAGGGVLVGTVMLLPLAYFVRHVPLVVRAAQAALEGYDDRLTEASADLGARLWTTLRRVVLPVILPGVLAGTLLTFVTALGEFVSSIMLYVYDNRPISVELFAKLRLYDLGAAAAYGVLLMALVVASVAVTRRLGARATFA
ncbi:MAG TPA: iron ABC transporter permease [Rubricoccaceae bacterium]|nr:iron ABC transporter permease [Rubricoccaceae bacterium]